ncbi:MAG: DUF6282 family protein [Planctomycetaceae bacterium]|nr:DUF6282 family protein [Planctomycetaceae bacterium]
MIQAQDLLRDAYDLHIHTAPDVVERKLSDLQVAKRLSACGMKGYAIKSHQFNTAGRAALVNEAQPGFHAVGGATLNWALGGINPAAVEMAGRLGTKIIWFPTVNAKNEHDFLAATGRQKPYGAGAPASIRNPPITVLNPSGELIPEAGIVLELIKQYDMVMATGHLSKHETLALVKAGRDIGLRKMLVTHPEYPACYATPAEQAEYVSHGAKIEYCYHTVWSGACSYDTLIEMIRTVGSENAIITSDLGQMDSPYPDDGLLEHLSTLLEKGVTRREIRTMVVDTPSYLVE